VSGDIYADLDWSFGVVGPALQNAHHWCEILMLPINIKGCRVSPGHDPELAHDSGLAVSVGRKHSRSLEDAFTLEFDFAVVASQRDYRRITLTAADGPLNTSNYRIMVEVADLDGEHTFMHLRYSYESGLAARVAMRGYLATAGRNKIGFSVVGRKENGDPVFTRGLRGVIERNTMRYYLAIEAYLASLAAHPSQRIDKRLNDWFFSCERYSAQLHELDHHEYVTMKRRELERQRE
jgi:hypothetical protein